MPPVYFGSKPSRLRMTGSSRYRMGSSFKWLLDRIITANIVFENLGHTLQSLPSKNWPPPPSPPPPPQPGLPITATLITGRQWHTDGDLSRTALPAWKRTSKVNMDKKTPAIILNTNGLIFSLTNCRTGVINDAKQSKQNHDYVCFSACLLFSFYSFPVSARNYVGSKYFPIPNDGTSLFLGFGGVNCLDRLDILVFVLLYF